MEEKLKSVPSSSNNHNVGLEEVEVLLNNHPLFLKNSELKQRFWDMFVVDALIGNNARNNGDWGVLVNNKRLQCSIDENCSKDKCWKHQKHD